MGSETANMAFFTIVLDKGLVDLEALQGALNKAMMDDLPLETVLVEAGDLNPAACVEILGERAKWGRSCTQCKDTTYVLPDQDAESVGCEACGGKLKPPRAPRNSTGDRARRVASSREERQERLTRARERRTRRMQERADSGRRPRPQRTAAPPLPAETTPTETAAPEPAPAPAAAPAPATVAAPAPAPATAAAPAAAATVPADLLARLEALEQQLAATQLEEVALRVVETRLAQEDLARLREELTAQRDAGGAAPDTDAVVAAATERALAAVSAQVDPEGLADRVADAAVRTLAERGDLGDLASQVAEQALQAVSGAAASGAAAGGDVDPEAVARLATDRALAAVRAELETAAERIAQDAGGPIMEAVDKRLAAFDAAEIVSQVVAQVGEQAPAAAAPAEGGERLETLEQAFGELYDQWTDFDLEGLKQSLEERTASSGAEQAATDAAKGAFDARFTALEEHVQASLEQVRSELPDATAWTAQAVQQALAAVEAQGSGQDLDQALSELRAEVTGGRQQAAERSQQGLDALRRDVEQLAGGLRGDVEQLTGGLRTELEQVSTGVRGELEQLSGSLRGELEQLSGGLRGELEQLSGGLRGELEQLATSLRSEVAEASAGPSPDELTQAATDRVLSTVEARFAALEQRVEELAGAAPPDLATLAEQAAGAVFRHLEPRLSAIERGLAEAQQQAQANAGGVDAAAIDERLVPLVQRIEQITNHVVPMGNKVQALDQQVTQLAANPAAPDADQVVAQATQQVLASLEARLAGIEAQVAQAAEAAPAAPPVPREEIEAIAREAAAQAAPAAPPVPREEIEAIARKVAEEAASALGAGPPAAGGSTKVTEKKFVELARVVKTLRDKVGKGGGGDADPEAIVSSTAFKQAVAREVQGQIAAGVIPGAAAGGSGGGGNADAAALVSSVEFKQAFDAKINQVMSYMKSDVIPKEVKKALG